MNRWSLMGKLGAMAGDTTTTVIDMTPGAVSGSMVNGPEDLIDWDAIDWRAEEEKVRRLRQRIFKAVQAGDWKQARNLQRLTAPRGALSYPRHSREELEGRFLGLMAYPDPKR